jgi:hypothetical protein
MNNRLLSLSIISLIVSLAIWVQIRLTSYQTATVKVQVRYTNLTDTLLANQLPERYRFRVRGKGLEIVKLRLSGAQAQYNALDIVNHDYPINPDKIQFDIPHTIKLDYIEPEPEIQTASQKRKPVRYYSEIELVFQDNDSRDFFYDNNYKLSVEKVEVSGSQNTSRTVKTLPISRSLLSKNKPKIKLSSPVDGIFINPDAIEIVKADKQLLTRVISSVRIESQPNTDFYPKEITIRIRGNNESIRNLSISEISAVLLLAEEDNFQIPIRVSLPETIELLDYSPQFVSRVSK